MVLRRVLDKIYCGVVIGVFLYVFGFEFESFKSN